MRLDQLITLFADQGCQSIFVKRLSPNDNSKNQVYLGGSFEVLNIFPVSEIVPDSSGNWKRHRFKASFHFAWIADDTNIYPAPNAQLILYPKYPEVRFSGFLQKCQKPPSELMTQRLADRLLFLSVSKTGIVLGYVAAPDSEIAVDFSGIPKLEMQGLFTVLPVDHGNSSERLIAEIRRIHELDWIRSKRLDRYGSIINCEAPNCGGYTLEAELGIRPNSYSEPDFFGWEVKQFGVSNFNKPSSAIITLMTPEPTGGYYVDRGVEWFVRTYGYQDKMGRDDRLNFGGIHKVDQMHNLTNLRMELIGFNAESGKIENIDGKVALVDLENQEAASWSFSALLQHWNRKHNQACYVPSQVRRVPNLQYRYGYNIILGTGTDFQLFLKEMQSGHIYYDPGIKIEAASTQPKIKRRSQFRVKSGYLANLYKSSKVLNIHQFLQ